MALQYGSGGEVVMLGVHESDTPMIERELMARGIELGGFCGPSGSVQAIREGLSQGMNGSDWSEGVHDLHDQVDAAAHNLQRTPSTPRIPGFGGYLIKRVQTGVPNQDYIPPVVTPNDSGQGRRLRFSGTRPFITISRDAMLAQAWPEEVEDPRAIAQALAVVVQFGFDPLYDPRTHRDDLPYSDSTRAGGQAPDPNPWRW